MTVVKTLRVSVMASNLGFHLLFVVLNCGLYDDEIFLRLVLHLFGSFLHLEVSCMKSSITEIEKWL